MLPDFVATSHTFQSRGLGGVCAPVSLACAVSLTAVWRRCTRPVTGATTGSTSPRCHSRKSECRLGAALDLPTHAGMSLAEELTTSIDYVFDILVIRIVGYT